MTQTSSTQKFIGRKSIIDQFKKDYDYQSTTTHIYMYYGAGGIGKSSLLQEMQRTISYSNKTCILDFAHFDIKSKQEVLLRIRRILGNEHGMDFPNFDIVYFYYMLKSAGQKMNIKDQVRNNKEYSIKTDLMKIAGKQLLQFTPVLNSLPELLSALGPLIDLYDRKKFSNNDIINIFFKLFKNYNDKKDSHYELMDVKMLFNELQTALLLDIEIGLKKETQPLYIFVDTYEIVENLDSINRYDNLDRWFCQLVAQSKQIQWVMFGRRTLSWDKNDLGRKSIIHREVTEMSNTEAEQLIRNSRIDSEKVIENIKFISKGSPFAINFAIQLHKDYSQSNGENLFLEKTQDELFSLLKKHMKRYEHNLLEHLSLCDTWDEPLLSAIEEKYNYHPEDFESLSRNFFIKPVHGNAKAWTMHDLMKEAMENRMHTRTLQRSLRFLFDYYKQKTDQLLLSGDFINAEKIFFKAYEFGFKTIEDELDEIEAYYLWLNQTTNQFVNHEQVTDDILNINRQFARYIKDKKTDYHRLNRIHAKLLYDIVYIYIDLDYKVVEREQILDEILNLTKIYFRADERLSAKVHYGYGRHFQKIEAYEQAIEHYEKAIFKYTQSNNLEGKAMILNALGHLYSKKEDKQEAEKVLKESIQIRENLNRLSVKKRVDGYLNLFRLYWQTGEFEKAIQILEKAKDQTKEALGNEYYLHYRIQNHLAITYIRQNKIEKARLEYEKLSEIVPETISDYSKILYNRAVTYYFSSKKDQAIKSLRDAIEYKKVKSTTADVNKSMETYEKMKSVSLNYATVYLQY